MNFEETLKHNHGIVLNPQQREAVFTTEGPVLLLAVPGSGKTTVVAARTAYMVLARGIQPQSILTLTFNRSSRLDMESRFQSLFGAAGVRFSTIHSFCYSVLQEACALAGRKLPELVEDRKLRILRAIHGKYNGSEWLPDDRLEELTNAIGFVKNRMLTEGEIRDGSWGIRNFPVIFAAYEAYKEDFGFIDFDDMLAKALNAFIARPALLESFRARYRYVSVDEAQDVSKLQHEIIRMLAAPLNNLFMVGDEDQSIYGFRAASPEYLLQFRQAYPDGKVLLMERNYRSAKAVVDAANRLIRRNAARHDKAMVSGGEKGASVTETSIADSSLVPQHIVSRLQSAGTGSAAVLFRENGSAAALIDALDRAGIPFRVREGRSDFFSHRAVRDVLAFLALAWDPLDAAALRQVYWKLGASVSRNQFDWCAAQLEKGGHASAIVALFACPGLKPESIERLKAVQKGLDELNAKPVSEVLPFILDRLGYRQSLKKTCGEGYGMLSALHALSGLASIAGGVESYDGLLGRIGRLAELAGRSGGAREGAVTLSTVHSAKGLEFDSVYVIDLVEGRFPTANAVLEEKTCRKAAMEEERRLFYVAVTRARKNVELVTADSVFGMKAKPSRFIQEALGNQSLRRALEKHLKKSPPDHAAEARIPIEIGMDVRHSSFGAGVVTAHDESNGVVSVRFPKYGVKVISEEFCRSEMKDRKKRTDEDS